MKLRPHHLLCTQGYRGRGYDHDFIQNMDYVVDFLRNTNNAVVDVVFSTDTICSKCPNMLAYDLCTENEKVKTLDQKVIDYFHIEEQPYIYQEIIAQINAQMTETIMNDICSACSWYGISACKQSILNP